jgi:hypothetical protein
MMLHKDEATAIQRGIDGAHFFGYSLGHYYGGTHLAGGTDLWRSFGEDRTASGFARELVAATAAPLAIRLLEAGLGSLRGAIGTPAQVTDLLARYEAAGVDQVNEQAELAPARRARQAPLRDLAGQAGSAVRATPGPSRCATAGPGREPAARRMLR